MTKLKEQALKIISYLSEEQKKEDIIEVENTDKNQKLLSYLNNIGSAEVEYEVKSDYHPGYIQEKGGITYLWYKKTDGSWIIKLWEINRLLN